MTKCPNCIAWEKIGTNIEGDVVGTCRRFAPKPAMYGLFTDTEGRYMEARAEWPITRETDGCCEAL